jgi:hypothetical protein
VGISEAFRGAVTGDGSGSIVSVGVLVVAAVAIVIMRLRRRRRGPVRVIASAPEVQALAKPGHERRAWPRITARLVMNAVRIEPARRGRAGRTHFDRFETRDIGPGGLTFACDGAPKKGTPMEFTLELGGDRPLSMRGEVVRVDPSPAQGGRFRVALQFRPIDERTREQLILWSTAETARALAEAHRGRLCPHCQRPLTSDAEEMHSTCAARAA